MSIPNSVISSLKIPKIQNQPSVSSAVVTPLEIKNLFSERDKLRKQIETLQSMLERVSKTIGNISRQHDGREWLDQAYVDNVKLQEDVQKRIQVLRNQQDEVERKLTPANCKNLDLTEFECGPPTSSPTSPTSTSVIGDRGNGSQQLALESFYDYYDPGSHWCSQCNEIIPDIGTYLKHMHSSKHWQRDELIDQIWKSKKFCKPKLQPPSHQQPQAIQIKGAQFFLPIKGFYCKLCDVMTANGPLAEEHLKTKEHNQAYTRYTLLNPNYEPKYSSDRAKAINRILKEKTKRREKEEKLREEKKASDRKAQTKLTKRDRIEEENKARKPRESVERKGEREFGQEKKMEKAFHEEAKKKRPILDISETDCSEKEIPVPKKAKIKRDMEKSSLSTIPVSRTDKKLQLQTRVSIPSHEWQLCYNKYIKMVKKKDLVLAVNSPVKRDDKTPKSMSQTTTTLTPVSLPSFRIDSDDEEKEPNCSNVAQSIGDIVTALTPKIIGSKSEKDESNATTFGNFIIEPDDDDDNFDLQLNSTKITSSPNFFSERDIFSLAIVPSIDSIVSDAPPSLILSDDDDPKSETSEISYLTSLAPGSKDTSLNSPESPFKSTFECLETIEKSVATLPSDYSVYSNCKYDQKEDDVVKHFLAIENECSKVKLRLAQNMERDESWPSRRYSSELAESLSNGSH